MRPLPPHSAFLLGMGPLPPPRPQDLAVAQFNALLNNGAFAHPQAVPGLQVSLPPSQIHSQMIVMPTPTPAAPALPSQAPGKSHHKAI